MFGPVGGGPAGEQAEGLLGGRTRLGGESEQGETSRTGNLERLETQSQVPDNDDGTAWCPAGVL